jgi:hypothetical protein
MFLTGALMKAWEEHDADLYLLAKDILDNMYAQRTAHRGGFYYAFNPHLSYRQTEGDFVSQYKLLDQLVENGVLEFVLKEPPANLPEQYISKNAQLYTGKRLKLKIKPRPFSDFLSDYQKYGRLAESQRRRVYRSAKFDYGTGQLQVGEHMVRFLPETNMHDVLRVILANKDSRLRSWSYSEMQYELSKPDESNGNDFLRHTSNNINRRVKRATNNAIPDFLQIAKGSVKLNKKFV